MSICLQIFNGLRESVNLIACPEPRKTPQAVDWQSLGESNPSSQNENLVS
jgi:hypothetical protein